MSRRRSYKPSFRRVRHWRPRFRTHKKDKRFSIIGTSGAVGSLFAGAANHKSIGSWIVDFAQGRETDIGNKAPYMMSDLIAQYTGYSYMDGTWNIPTGTLVLVGSSIAAGVAGRFGNKYLKNIPLIGKYVKM